MNERNSTGEANAGRPPGEPRVVELTPEESDLLLRCLGGRIEKIELDAGGLSFVKGGSVKNPGADHA